MRKIIFIAIAVCWITASGLVANTDKVELFGEKYRSAATPDERRKLCIQAIDEKLLKAGVPIETVYVLFGVGPFGWGIQRCQPNTEDSFIIHFADFHKSEKVSDKEMGPVSVPWSGWYLYVHFDPKHGVSYYYISNTWTP